MFGFTKYGFDADNLVGSVLVTCVVVLVALLASFGVLGMRQFYLSTFTGPCGSHGGFNSYTARQDYAYCADGTRVATKVDDTRTATYNIKVSR